MTDTAPELLPCPFCGGEATVVRSPYALDYMVGCNECDMAGQAGFSSKAEAVEHWNTRADLAVKVRPLEWEGDVASSNIGFWQIIRDNWSYGLWCSYTPRGPYWGYRTIEEAKAAAQADYERRITSAMEFSCTPTNLDNNGTASGSQQGAETSAESDWQPIETAPKDGSLILLGGVMPEEFIEAGQWQVIVAYWTPFNHGGWVWHGPCPSFTHWMPLPEAPALAAMGGKE